MHRFYRFLGIDRFQELARALKQEALRLNPNDQSQTSESYASYTSYTPAFIALGIAALPALIQIVRLNPTIDSLGITTGIATILAVLYRRNLKIEFARDAHWKTDLSLVHTAFAVGCIPTGLILLFAPEWLAPVQEQVQAHLPRETQRIELLQALRFIFIASIWAALTEEFLYRGLLISVLRRTPVWTSQVNRDRFALMVSSLLFGISHLVTWGPGPALAVTGLGFGFGLGYIATKEKLLPVILYHALFDAVSLSITVFL